MYAKKSSGFTIVELIVVITIIMLVTTGVIAGYSRANDTQKVKQAAKTLMTNLRRVQTDARAGIKPSGCTTSGGIQITINQGATSYTTQRVCSNPIALVGEVVTYSLPGDVRIRYTGSGSSTFKFYYQTFANDGGIDFSTNLPSDRTLILYNPDSSKEYGITVNSVGGNLTDSGFSDY